MNSASKILETLDPLAPDFKDKLEQYIDAKIDDALGNYDFSGIVDDRIGDMTISASNVDGLDEAVSEAVSNLTFEVSVS